MSFTIGQSVKVKTGQQDEDTSVSIAGWTGRVVAIDTDHKLLEMAWDSNTLRQMPDTYIRRSIDGGFDYTRYHIFQTDVEPVPATDSPADTERIKKELANHYHEYEMYGRPPLAFQTEESDTSTADFAAVNDAKRKLITELSSITGSGSFVSSGVQEFVHPGLRMEGVGEIGLPISDLQVEAIIQQAKQAPFGKGSQTVVDTSVRSAWEIDANSLSFHHQGWNKALQKIVKKVQKDLGVAEHSVSASLYKMLIYQQGDFFLAHQDSEKERGMFATLVVCLPSAHEGGALVVRFDGREEVIDFAPTASNYQMPYAAFYADCEHEVKPVTSGYRVGLVYNLLQTDTTSKIHSPIFNREVARMVEVLPNLADYYQWKPLAVVLGHQYTPTNFSLAQLKLHDRPRAEALLAAAEQANFFASLGLVTHYRMGQLEGKDYYYSRDYYEDEEEDAEGGTMGEIYEEYTTIEYWGAHETPGLGEIDISEHDILGNFDIDSENPITKEEEGYTGNAGMTVQYWYHYGAIILWPKTRHFALLKNRPVPVKLSWLAYYLRHWENAEIPAHDYTRQLLVSIAKDVSAHDKYPKADYSPVAEALVKLQDKSFLQQHGPTLLPPVFADISIISWTSLLGSYDSTIFDPILQKAALTDKVQVIRHFTEVLLALEQSQAPIANPFVAQQVRQFPEYLRLVQLHQLKESTYYNFESFNTERKTAITTIVENILSLSHYHEKDAAWLSAVLQIIAESLPRKYVHEVLASILLAGQFEDNLLAKALYQLCLQNLTDWTATKPTPPADWTRDVPTGSRYQGQFNIIAPFLRSPTEKVFDYIMNESYRSQMEYAIKSVEIDLQLETIRKGRPYTLRLTKTQANYERKLREWEEDLALLNKLQSIANQFGGS